MTDVRNEQEILTSSDAFYQKLALGAALGCEHWATPLFDGTLDVLLWPRDRGDFPHGIPYRVNTRVVERGVWRVTLCPEDALPAGVDVSTRDAVVKAQIALDGLRVPFPAIDQVVQCGLFGEVLYR